MSESVLDHPLISQRYFFPRRAPLTQTRWVEVEGAKLACYEQPGEKILVHFHGNGEVVADYVPDLSQVFQKVMNTGCFFSEYRGYGGSTGTPELGMMLHDIPAIFEAIGKPAEQLIVFGRSVGSIFALEFAYRYPKIGGLIIESGIADPLERLALRVRPEELGVDAPTMAKAVAERLDHQKKISAYPGPLLVMHAKGDDLVDVSHAERLAS